MLPTIYFFFEWGRGGEEERGALWHALMYYFFSVKQNVKDIFTDGHSKKKAIFGNRLKKLNFYKTFENIIENVLDFHGYGTPKIEIQ